MNNQYSSAQDQHTSAVQDPSTNTGESYGDNGPKDIVNEQEQNKSVNQEEYIDDQAVNKPVSHKEKAQVEVNSDDDDDDDEKPLVPEIGDDPDEAEKKIPTMK